MMQKIHLRNGVYPFMYKWQSCISNRTLSRMPSHHAPGYWGLFPGSDPAAPMVMPKQKTRPGTIILIAQEVGVLIAMILPMPPTLSAGTAISVTIA